MASGGLVAYLGSVSDRPAASDSSLTDPRYSERLWVPVGWWVLTVIFALMLCVATLFYLGWWLGIGAGLLVLAVMSPLWIGYGRAQVAVTRDRLWAGQANIEWRYLSAVRSLDPIATRQRRGTGADARAFLLLRPYLDKAVEVTLCDPQDRTPYWLIGSRRPNRLANNIRAQLAASHSETQQTGESKPQQG
jgi:hypothetical protein